MAFSRSFLIVLALVGLVAVVILENSNASNQPLSISEVACVGPNYGLHRQFSPNIWMGYTLVTDAQRLASIIPTCQSNPTAGYVGGVSVDAIEPDGTIYNLGRYSATQNSTQKISCGTNQGGKESVGGTIPNQGLGTYQIRVSGVYYLPSENYAIPHSFQWTEATTISCLLPGSSCNDGTIIGQCSTSNQGYICADSAELYPRASVCDCPAGQVVSGNLCTSPPLQDNVTLPAGQPLPPMPTVNTTQTTIPPINIPASTIPQQFIFGFKVRDVVLSIAAIIMLIAYLIYKRR